MSRQSEDSFLLEYIPGRFLGYILRYSIFIGFSIFLGVAASISRADNYEGYINPVLIDSIEIDNQNIFNVDSAKYNYWIYRLANRLHIKTRPHIIRRELLLNKGDLFSERLASESERNLRALPYLWNADISLYRSGDSLNILRVTTADSWTMLVGLSISRNSDEIVYHTRFEELNLFGLGQSLSLHYYIREFRDDYGQLSYTERRLFGSRNYLNLFYDGNPEVGLKGFSAGRPFFSLDSRIHYSISYSAIDRRNDKYSDSGIVTGWEQISGDRLKLTNFYRLGSYQNKIQLGIEYEYKDISPTDTFIISPSDNNTFSDDSLYWSITPEIGMFNLHYIGTTRINTFRTTEDILLEKGGKVEVGWAFDASSHHNIYRTLAFTGEFRHYIKSNLIISEIKHSRWFNGNITYRKAYGLSIKYYNNYLTWLTPMFRAVYNSDDIRDTDGTLYLGENNGLRGYPRNYSTGEKRLVVNIENRFYSGLEFYSVDIGAVQFFDIGRCWPGEKGVRLKDFYWSAGIGLRFSAERISNAKMMRLDLAYADELEEWQLSFGVGHYID